MKSKSNCDSEKVFLTAKTDRVFKEIFFKEENRDLLLELLNTCLPIKVYEIKSVNSELVEGNIHTRRKILDMLLETKIGIINLEINRCNYDYVHPRNMAYICNVFANRTERGKNYRRDDLIIQINLTFGINEEEPFMIYQMANMTSKDKYPKIFVDNFIIYEYDMDRIKRFWYDKDEENIEKYKMLIMLDLPRDELEKLSLGDERVVKFKMELDDINDDLSRYEFMTPEKDNMMIENSLKEQFKREGLEEGLEQGLEQGIEQGIEQGRQEEKKNIIKSLYENGVSLELISASTKMTIEEVNDIINNIEKEN